MINGDIIFQDLHFERLFSSLQTMQFEKPDFFTADYLLQQIQELVKANNHQPLARIRVTIFRGDGNLYDTDHQPNFIIQSHTLTAFPAFNEQGFCIAVYKDARKTCDVFSHIKSNNYLPYAMAALWSRKNNFDDALIVNCYNRIAEATTSNIFLVKDGIIKTPLLSEGCISGVTRQYLLPCFQSENILCEETILSEDDILNADEIFLTNTGFYIQWIRQYGTKFYANKTAKELYEQFIAPLFIRI